MENEETSNQGEIPNPLEQKGRRPRRRSSKWEEDISERHEEYYKVSQGEIPNPLEQKGRTPRPRRRSSKWEEDISERHEEYYKVSANVPQHDHSQRETSQNDSVDNCKDYSRRSNRGQMDV